MSFGKFLVRRMFLGIFVVWGVITIMFGLRAVSPGDPATLMLAEGASRDLIERVREIEGLNEPLYVQYYDYVSGIVVGDFGYSWQSSRQVELMVIERVPATLELAIAGTLVAVVIAIPLGVISATRRNQPADYGASLFSLLGISTPNFWLGLMLILILGVWAGLLPTGRRPFGMRVIVEQLVIVELENGLSVSAPLNVAAFLGAIWIYLQHIALPALTLGTYFTALITRLTRSGMIDELGKPYVTATEAKGLPGVLVRYKHVLRNTMIPIVTVIGLQMGTLMGGAVITETVFNWPGLGLRLIDALDARDWPLMQGIIVFIAIAFVVINIMVDALYTYLDPRVSAE